jgi:hypothetical protein
MAVDVNCEGNVNSSVSCYSTGLLGLITNKDNLRSIVFFVYTPQVELDGRDSLITKLVP